MTGTICTYIFDFIIHIYLFTLTNKLRLTDKKLNIAYVTLNLD